MAATRSARREDPRGTVASPSPLERGPALKAILVSGRKPAGIAEELYLTILSRKPTQQELKTVADYVHSTRTRKSQAATDVAWALINSPEFLYRH